MPPTVPEGTQRVRVCLHAGNTEEEVRRLVGALEEWCVERVGAEKGEWRKTGGEVLARL